MALEADIAQMSAIELAEAIASRRLSSRAVVESCLDRIEAHDEAINAFVHVDREAGLEAADEIDRELKSGRTRGPLAGLPFAVKDFSDVHGMPTCQGSRAFGSPLALDDEPMIARLRAAGAVPVGKTNAPEFGLHSATYNERFGVTRNPWNLEKTPGGSSGGSAAAVAAGLVPFATGSDGGGSIRTPAAFCGLVGLKTTTALVPRASGDSTLSCLGYLTKTVADTARLLDVTAGPHPSDRLSAPGRGAPFEPAIETLSVAGSKVAWSDDLGYAPMEPEVVALARSAFERLAQAAELEVVDVDAALPNVYRAWVADSVSLLAAELQADGVSFGLLDQRTQRLLAEHVATDLADHVRVRRAYAALEEKASALFRSIDVLATPSTSCPAFGADEEIPSEVAGRDATWTGAEPVSMFANVIGAPAISIPAGVTRDGLPVGLQLAARRFDDVVLLRLARILEQVQPWPRLAPGYAG
ncbi:MAG: amidase [Maricaulaceae bacterium]|jgi:Asp-tRNA(Asn)/Glu-tRNA(Gln) amidotransferase A subunit family amidase